MTAPLQADERGRTDLPDGRTMSWAAYGDPAHDVAFWFHGTPGAMGQLPHDAADAATARGLRIVTVERPGVGRSTPHRYRTIRDFAPDLLAVADHLEAEEFGCVGLSGGGPYLLGVAHAAPDRMRAGIVLGGVGPTRGRDAVPSHTLLLRPLSGALNAVAVPIGAGLSRAVRLAAPLASPAVDLFFAVQPGDRRAFGARPLDKAQFTSDLIRAAYAADLRAPIEDLSLFGRHWGFHLDEINVPIVFHSGESDVIVPHRHARHQQARVPGSRLAAHPGRGHFAGYTDPELVLDDLRALWPTVAG